MGEFSVHVCQMIDGFSNAGAQRVVAVYAGQARILNMKVTAVGLNEPKSGVIRTELERQGARVEIFPAEKLSDPGRIIRLAGFLKAEKVDLIQTHLSYANILGSAAGRLAGIPVVSTLHTSQYRNQFYRPAVFRAEMFALRFLSSRIIAVARAVTDVYRPFLGRKEITVIPNPVQPAADIEADERAEMRSQFLEKAESPLLVSVGRLTPPKGYTDLISAFRWIQAARKDARLVIAGAGEEYASLQCLLGELGLEGKVFLLGERADVPRLLSASDLFLSASLWEGMPLSILEAMAAGLPVVATAVGGVPEILAGHGILVPPRNPEALSSAALDLLSHPDRMKALGQTARDYTLTEHSPDKWFARLAALFQNVILRV